MDFYIDPQYSGLYVFTKNGIQIISISSNNTLLLLEAELQTKLIINSSSSNFTSLNKNCALNNLNLLYNVYPLGFENDKVLISF